MSRTDRIKKYNSEDIRGLVLDYYSENPPDSCVTIDDTDIIQGNVEDFINEFDDVEILEKGFTLLVAGKLDLSWYKKNGYEVEQWSDEKIKKEYKERIVL